MHMHKTPGYILAKTFSKQVKINRNLTIFSVFMTLSMCAFAQENIRQEYELKRLKKELEELKGTH